ncbi:MAG: hypothetical protein M1830_003880 [Pleopsidium flavum]|nr:MAG: hypothetical protein M1830_003880 [Pleopsidium flavum]
MAYRATTLGGTTAPTIHLSKLVERDMLENTWPWLDVGTSPPPFPLSPVSPANTTNKRTNLTTPRHHPTGVTVLLRPSTETSIWTSLPSPRSFNPTIALGTSHGITLLAETPSNWIETRTINLPSDVFALEWLGANGVLVAGCRNGSVKVYDQRSPERMEKTRNGLGGRGFRHGSAVVGVRNVGQWGLVVCGLESKPQLLSLNPTPPHRNPQTKTNISSLLPVKLSLYDLRYTKASPQSQSQSQSQHRPQTPTTPLLTYPHKNTHTPSLGFDISTSLNLVAAATDGTDAAASSSAVDPSSQRATGDDGSTISKGQIQESTCRGGIVNLFSLYTGEKVRTLSLSLRGGAKKKKKKKKKNGKEGEGEGDGDGDGEENENEGALVRCLSFEDIGGGGGAGAGEKTTRLVMGKGGGGGGGGGALQEWAW